MAKYFATEQLNEKNERTVKLLKTVGTFSEVILFLVGIGFLLAGQTTSAIIFIVLSIGGMVVFWVIIPNSFKKTIDRLQELDSLIELTPEHYRHAEFIFSWEGTNIMHATLQSAPDEHSTVRAGNYIYLLSRQTAPDDFAHYSDFTYSYSVAPYAMLRVNLSYLAEPEAFLEELKTYATDYQLDFFETDNSRQAEKYIRTTYK
ncbi:hypothetical protein IV487_09085 [Enterococcus saccharolyticus]|uniref:hypothetical protein n=1 Tax=Enterococcus saccharolyticus TaxID=41997 RepID=UPI001E2CA5F7|nr:hypothetical protein [Enterococcus saccharolyticus]MCD5002617.1 hypothetical protein [Enterococcus saccharolyticus]